MSFQISINTGTNLHAFIKCDDGRYLPVNSKGDALEEDLLCGFKCGHASPHPLWINITPSIAARLSHDGSPSTDAVYLASRNGDTELGAYSKRLRLASKLPIYKSKQEAERDLFDVSSVTIINLLKDMSAFDERGILYQVAILMHDILIGEMQPTLFDGTVKELLDTRVSLWRNEPEFGFVGDAFKDLAKDDAIKKAIDILSDTDNLAALADVGVIVQLDGDRVKVELQGAPFKYLQSAFEGDRIAI